MNAESPFEADILAALDAKNAVDRLCQKHDLPAVGAEISGLLAQRIVEVVARDLQLESCEGACMTYGKIAGGVRAFYNSLIFSGFTGQDVVNLDLMRFYPVNRLPDFPVTLVQGEQQQAEPTPAPAKRRAKRKK